MCAKDLPLHRQRGLTLIELIVFIVVVSVGLAGVIAALQSTERASPDPFMRQQALAAADALLAEIISKPFTYCDPSDANFLTAANTAACASLPETTLGPINGETRFSSSNPFANVGNYAGYQMNGNIVSVLDGTTVTLPGYSASVSIVQDGAAFSLPADAVLRIEVTITPPSGAANAITQTGYRFRYAPNNA